MAGLLEAFGYIAKILGELFLFAGSVVGVGTRGDILVYVTIILIVVLLVIYFRHKQADKKANKKTQQK